MIRIEDNGSLRIVRMEHGKVNALDRELCESIGETFESLAGNDQVAAVVLTGAGPAFSAGVDLHRIVQEGIPYVESFLVALERAFRAVYTCPRPVVAAINGHAIAGGCVLAAACDERIVAEGPVRIGVPELLVGVNFPPLAREIMYGLLSPADRARVMVRGEIMSAERAQALSLVDEIVPAEDLPGHARKRAGALGGIAPVAFADLKRGLRAPRLSAADTDTVGRQTTLDLWKREETFERIRTFLEKTIRRK